MSDDGEGPDIFALAKKMADAILYEGYVLYPYRASAAKNQVRWQFGVLAPNAWSQSGGPEPWEQQVQLLAEPEDGAVLQLRLRFLQVQAKRVEERRGDGSFSPVETLTVGGTQHITWEEAVEHQLDYRFPIADLAADEATIALKIAGGEDAPESVSDAEGGVAGRILRRRQQLQGLLRVSAEPLPGPFGAYRLRLRIENLTPYDGSPDDRRAAMSYSFIACHTLWALTPARHGRFISLLEPPAWAKAEAQACENLHAFPVLIGDRQARDVMFASPIILYDWPQIAPESPGDLFDGTEVDELLSLNIMTMTDEEKKEARATDPRAKAIIDRVDAMPQELLDRLHGAVRYLRDVTGELDDIPEFGTGADGLPVYGEERPMSGRSAPGSAVFGREFDDRRPAGYQNATAPAPDPAQPWWEQEANFKPDTDTAVINGVPVAAGGKVILRPGTRRADAQDMFLAGKVADVQAVFYDLENKQFLAVTLEEDPNADLQVENGRFLYFAADEVEPVVSGEVPA
ncbi:MAG TPA: hypothetical protein VFW71_05320 [Actinomycetota bacterium]|nr:hypothetical protein [Actinomycetota bacterium]